MAEEYDAVVIGGGPAGLACALWLARYRLHVRLFDAGDPRNAPTWAVHGYLGLQDIAPMQLRRIGREQALSAGAELEAATVRTVTGRIDAFDVHLTDGLPVRARRVIFATGLRDIIPEIPGLLDFYGTSIWHCPDCDGPSVRDLRVGVIGWGRSIVAFCMDMLTWTDHMVVLTHGREAEMPPSSREALRRFGLPLRTEPIERIEGQDGEVRRVVLQGGEELEVDAMFFHIAYGPGCSIPAELGCQADDDGSLIVDADHETSVPGIYAAGDITRGSKLAIRAAAEGTRAAIGVRRSLLPPERRV